MGGPRGWVHCATYLRTVRTVWGTKIGTTGETPGSHVLEAAEDGQCDGRGGGFADGVGERKIKKRAAGPTQGHPREGRKKGGPGHGRHCIRAPHRMAHGAIRRGLLVLYRLYSVTHTVRTRTRDSCDILKKHGKVADLQFFCSARGRGGRGRETEPPQVVTLLNPFGPAGSLPPRQPPG